MHSATKSFQSARAPRAADSTVASTRRNRPPRPPGLSRRDFLGRSAWTALGAAMLSRRFSGGLDDALGAPAPSGLSGRLKKAVCIGVLPRELSVLEKFQLAKKAGIEGIEPNTIYPPDDLSQYREAAAATGVRVHSIMNSDHWRYSLTDNDPAVVRKCVEGIKTSLHNAKELGADTVLLVPGIVTREVRYGEVYARSQKQIRELLPLAEELRVIIAIENVGNRFLLSPLEFVRYIDEMNSPYLQGYFDMGNLGRNGFPQDWIRTIGRRLVKVHLKGFEPGRDAPKPDPRNETIDWIEIRRALSDIGYQGWVSAEVRSGDEAYLQELARRMDKFFAGQSPV